MSFKTAMRRVLRPLVRAMIARGLGFPELSEMLKPLFIEEAEAHFGIEGRRMTDSRVSLLTGLQRRDIRAHRAAPPADEPPSSAGPIPRVIALWQSDARFADDDGQPAPLPRSAEADGSAESFESLVFEIGRDVHPRTILDEMVRLGLVLREPETDRVTLVVDALVPSKNESLLIAYYAANLGDHAEAAAANLMAAPDPGPFYERAVHYNELTPKDAAALEAAARARAQALLEEINADALARQRASRGSPEATERFRLGAFVLRRPMRGRSE